MTTATADDFAFSDHANNLRRDKAIVIARWLHAQRLNLADATSLNEDERKHAEREAGKARPENPKPITTSHRAELWTIVLAVLAKAPPHPPEAPDGHRECGCPSAGRVTDVLVHRAFHDLVEKQTGIAWGQPLDLKTLRAKRGRG